MSPGTRLTFHDDPAAFLEAAGRFLALDPVVSTVVATVTERRAREDRAGVPRPEHPLWWVLVEQGTQVVGAAMRTAPFAPYPLFVLPMPEDAAVLLAGALHERGEEVGGVNGALPATRALAEESARLQGRVVEVVEQTRLFGLPRLVTPAPVAGSFRLAVEADLDVVLAWWSAFHVDAMAQAGRTHDPALEESLDPDGVARRVADSVVGLWEVDGEVVHLTGWNPPAYGVSRVGPVYTPPERRGRGYASAAVAEVSQRILAAGDRACLFTDLANPTSNRVYEALGYRRLVDMTHLAVRPS